MLSQAVTLTNIRCRWYLELPLECRTDFSIRHLLDVGQPAQPRHSIATQGVISAPKCSCSCCVVERRRSGSRAFVFTQQLMNKNTNLPRCWCYWNLFVYVCRHLRWWQFARLLAASASCKTYKWSETITQWVSIHIYYMYIYICIINHIYIHTHIYIYISYNHIVWYIQYQYTGSSHYCS